MSTHGKIEGRTIFIDIRGSNDLVDFDVPIQEELGLTLSVEDDKRGPQDAIARSLVFGYIQNTNRPGYGYLMMARASLGSSQTQPARIHQFGERYATAEVAYNYGHLIVASVVSSPKSVDHNVHRIRQQEAAARHWAGLGLPGLVIESGVVTTEQGYIARASYAPPSPDATGNPLWDASLQVDGNRASNLLLLTAPV